MRAVSIFAARLKKLILVLVTPYWLRALLFHRVAASVEHLSALNRISVLAPDLIVDVGANRGQFALVVRKCFPHAEVLSFEPLPSPASRFRSLFFGDKSVRLEEYAIAPVGGERVIHVSRRDDSSSLLPISSNQTEIFPGTEEVGVSTIRACRLSDCMPGVDSRLVKLLKVDVQGFELSALQGTDDVIEHFSWVYVECSFLPLYEGQALASDVIDWLSDKGFRLCGLYNMHSGAGGHCIQADFLFFKSGSVL